MHEVNEHGSEIDLAGGTPSSPEAAISDQDKPKPPFLDTFGNGLTVAVIGASGGIGGAFAELLGECPAVKTVIRLSRNRVGSAASEIPSFELDLDNETSIADAAISIGRAFGRLNLVIVATGVLH